MLKGRRISLFVAFWLGISCIQLYAATNNANVVASILPLRAIVARIMAGVGKPIVLLKPYQNAHHGSLKPSQARLMAKADLLFWMGPELEIFLSHGIETLVKNGRAVSMITQAETSLLHNEQGQADFHLWLSPQNIYRLAQLVAGKLSQYDEAHQTQYTQNLQDFKTELDGLELRLEQIFSVVNSRPYLVEHEALLYLAKRYKLNFRYLVRRNEELAPSARNILQWQALINSGDYDCLILAQDSNNTALKSLALEAALPVILIDPIGASLPGDANQSLRLLERIANQIAACK